MSRFRSLTFLILALGWCFQSGVADDGSKEEGSDEGNGLKTLQVPDISKLSKRELIPPVPGFTLPEGSALQVAVIPVRTQIGKPSLYVLRRSMKEAIAHGAHMVILDMDTPGGALDSTLEMMEILHDFNGTTVTFVNDEAISAGAIISSVTDYIYFSPLGIMGAAAAVASTGQEIPDTMRHKIQSYLDARIRSYAQNKRYRSEVLKAMMDKDYELTIENTIIKEKDALLSLTSAEAVVTFGEPAQPLLAVGIAQSIDEILEYGFGVKDAVVERFEVSWSEELASWIEMITPVLFGIGIIMLIVEIKTPSFGLLGILGLGLILFAFFGHTVAGLAGYEALLLLLGGGVLIAVELFFLPGTLIFGFLGIICVMGAMVWSLADVWPVTPEPGEAPVDWRINPDSLVAGVYNLFWSLVIAVGGLALIWRFLPQSKLLRRVMVESTVADPSPVTGVGGSVIAGGGLPDVGSVGTVTRDLHPLGEVVIDGKHYEASTAVGALHKGEPVIVIGYKSYSLLVEKRTSS